MDAQIGEHQLGTACRGRTLPDGHDMLHEGINLRAEEVVGSGGEEPCIEGELAAVCGDGKRIILPRLHRAGADGFIACDEAFLDGRLLV